MLISQAMDAEPMDSVVVFFHSETPDFQTVEKSESLGIKGVVGHRGCVIFCGRLVQG